MHTTAAHITTEALHFQATPLSQISRNKLKLLNIYFYVFHTGDTCFLTELNIYSYNIESFKIYKGYNNDTAKLSCISSSNKNRNLVYT